MFADWFGKRFEADARQSARMSAVRIALAFVLVVVLGQTATWSLACVWGVGVLSLEGAYRVVLRQLAARGAEPRNAVWAVFWLHVFTVIAWNSAGVLLWLGGRGASDVVAAAFFAGHLLYLQTHHSRAPGSMVPASPALASPILTPLLFPHFSGWEQAIVVLTLTAVAAHAAISMRESYLSAKLLERTTGALVEEKEKAEVSRSAMAEAKEAAEAANAAKSIFLANMSHEIRTPLNGVLGMAQAMAFEDIPNSQREHLAVIVRSGQALLGLLNDVLDISKIEAGKLELDVADVDLQQIVLDLRDAFVAACADKDVDLRVEIDPSLAGRWAADPVRVRQIVSNLLSNAVKFTERGHVDLMALTTDQGVEIRIADTGLGIPPERLAAIFQSFVQADASTTRTFGGTGLGLTICRELVDLMGGHITVESQVGAGSVFTVRLPLVRGSSAEGAGKAAGAQLPDRPIRILAVEDHKTNQMVLQLMLAQAGLDMHLAENGQEAVEAWRSGTWDLILIDVQMPVMDGPTAVRLIRKEETASGRSRTPIVALTANAMRHHVDEYVACGMDGFVAKPFEFSQLIDTIAQHLTASEPVVSPIPKSV